MLLSPIAFSAGAMTWSLAEYCIHRFVGHGPKRKAPEGLAERVSPQGLAYEFNREHIAHHVDPMYFAPTERKLMAAAVVGVGAGLVASTVFGPRKGISYVAGLISAYGGYEVVHRRIHTHAPTGEFTRWVRKNHWFHHRAPKSNHGVTSALWDKAFGTYVEPGLVKLSRSIAPDWMLDEQGELKLEYRGDYELVGAPMPAQNAASPARA